MQKTYTVLVLLLLSFLNAKSQATQWAKSLPGNGTGNEVRNPKVHVDATGNIISAGRFKGTMDMDPGPGVVNVSSTASHLTEIFDSYIVKLDPSGNFIWAKTFNCWWNDYATDVKTDLAGNVFVAGYFTDSMDADPGPGTHILRHDPYSFNAYYIVKLDANGNFLWATAASPYTGNPSGTQESNTSIAVDPSGNLWEARYLDLGAICRITKYSSSGGILLTKDVAAINGYLDGRLAFDNTGSVYLAGAFSGTVDFDPGVAINSVTAVSHYNGFLLKMNGSLDFQWVKQFKASASPSGTHATGALQPSVDGANNIYVMGWFMGNVDFDPGPGVNSDTGPNEDYCFFILKLTPSGTLSWVRTYMNANGWLFWLNQMAVDPTGNVYATGSFQSAMEFNRKRTPSLKLTAPGRSQHMFVLKLDQLGATEWVKQMGGDRDHNTVGSSLAVTQDRIVAAGTFMDTLKVDWGLPNSLSLGASLNDVSHAFFVSLNNCSVDTGLTISGPMKMLTANLSGAAYQWKDCATGASLAGATTQSFTPASNGNYRVVITDGACVDSSECYSITGLGVNDKSSLASVKAFPNPTTGVITIALGKKYELITVELRNEIGQLMSTDNYNDLADIKMDIKGAAGLYFINIVADDGKSVGLRVLKQ
ncbi:MAG: T9SS type A sorting domain-containing protein [Sphingobacteriales bacterium]|nr:MAG: T9SS type A sorting domain-containing protein [Sphingobacteriales bacterium]